MIKKELLHRSHHYVVLLLGEASLFTAFLLWPSQTTKLWIAIVIGVFYTIWGIATHRGEIKTRRLILEYAAVGLLASVLLLSLISVI